MTIADLYRNFDVRAACEIISRTERNRPAVLAQIIAFNMLMAWALWPEHESQAKARRAARVTARPIMIQFLLQAEKAYVQAQQQGMTATGDKRVRKKESHYLVTLFKEIGDASYFTFMDEVILPLGGWSLVYKTVSNASFKKQIRQRWSTARFAALTTDILIRYAAADLKHPPSLNRAADFISSNGYGQDLRMGRSDVISLWAQEKSKAPLLYACWKASPDHFLLEDFIRPSRQLRRLIQTAERARHILEEAEWAKERLLEVKNVANENPAFLDLAPLEPQQSRKACFSAPALSGNDREILNKYRAPTGRSIAAPKKVMPSSG